MPQVIKPHMSMLRARNFATADVTVVASTWVEYGRYTVPQGRALSLGYGMLAGQDNAIGRIYMTAIDDTAGDATAEPGMFRINLENAADRHYATIFEGRTEQLATSATDRRQQIPFPEVPDVAPEDYDVVVLFNSDAADILQFDFCVFQISVTMFDLLRG